jgi:hypothetical protein
MTIASKSGGLIIKSGALATSCSCCGDGICPCVANMPTAFAARLKNIQLSFQQNFNTQEDLSGGEALLAAFIEKYEIILARTSVVGPGGGVTVGFARYTTTERCYSQGAPCVALSASCTDASRYEYLFSVDAQMTVLCDEKIRELEIDFRSSRPCWNQFPNNQTNRDFGVRISYWGNIEPFSFFEILPYPFCGDPNLVLEQNVPENFFAPGPLHAGAFWGTADELGLGVYEITGGTVELTPLFGNPLP